MENDYNMENGKFESKFLVIEKIGKWLFLIIEKIGKWDQSIALSQTTMFEVAGFFGFVLS